MPIVPLNFFKLISSKIRDDRQKQFKQMLQESERNRNKLEACTYWELNEQINIHGNEDDAFETGTDSAE